VKAIREDALREMPDALFITKSMIELLKDQLAQPLDRLGEAVVARSAYICKLLNEIYQPQHDQVLLNAHQLVLNNIDLLNVIVGFFWPRCSVRSSVRISKAFNKVVIPHIWAEASFVIHSPPKCFPDTTEYKCCSRI
jgi:hypothetical protein